MRAGQIILILYALILGIGGVVGYLQAGSKASLIAGAGSAVLLFICLGVSYGQLVVGLALGALIAGLLMIRFALRVHETKKIMPQGIFMMISLVVFICLAYFASEARKSMHRPKGH